MNGQFAYDAVLLEGTLKMMEKDLTILRNRLIITARQVTDCDCWSYLVGLFLLPHDY